MRMRLTNTAAWLLAGALILYTAACLPADPDDDAAEEDWLLTGLVLAAGDSGSATGAGCSGTATAFDDLPAQKVLMLGNSLTYFNGGIYSQLAAMSSSLTIDEVAAGHGGYCLGPTSYCGGNHHNDYQTGGRIKTLIDAGDYDFIVFQDQSQFPFFQWIDHWSNLDHSWAPLIKATNPGARMLLFMSWEHDDTPAMTTTYLEGQFQWVEGGIDGSHGDIADVVYVGSAFDVVQKQDGITLKSDAIHPNADGTYLAAVSFFHHIYPEVSRAEFAERQPCADATLIERGFASYP